ncbi:hypothetical protein PTKIN_Ptkin01aG0132300 [Pterospermum kingtungense]
MQVNNLFFLADFYVIRMEDHSSSNSALIPLGRPFLIKVAKTKIDVDAGKLTMEFDGEIIQFNILEVMKYHDDDHSGIAIGVVDELVQETVAELNDTSMLQHSD